MDGLHALYTRHADGLQAYGMMLCRDPDKVQDALHDLFVYLWQHRERIALPASGKAYLLVSLRRRLFDKGPATLRHLEPVEESDASQHLTSEDPETTWILRESDEELQVRLKTAMQELSDRQREILHLKYVEQLDYEAIGQAMDLNYQSARNLVNRALMALRRIMQGPGVIFLAIATLF